MGSANLNDRSMWGSRDSELACYIEGDEDTEIHYNHKIYKVNSKILDFRMELFMEHFGLPHRDVLFPNSNLFWTKATNQVKINTFFYDTVFKALPSNLYSTWPDALSRKPSDTSRKIPPQFKRDRSAILTTMGPAESLTASKNVSATKSTSPTCDRELFDDLVKDVKGHAVQYPYDFLRDEKDLLRSSVLLNHILPRKTLY